MKFHKILIFFVITILTLVFLSIYKYKYLIKKPIQPQNATEAYLIPTSPILNDSELTLAISKLESNRIFTNQSVKECITFHKEGVSNGYIDIVVRELHNAAKGCEGDPNTAPVFNRFQVSITSSEILLYDPLKGTYNPVTQCDIININLSASQFVPESSGKSVVTQVGRTYFYSAPNESCRIQNLFIINGDKITSQVEYHGFTLINYKNPKTQITTIGWVLSANLGN